MRQPKYPQPKVGDRFNRLVVVAELSYSQRGKVFHCICDCGNVKAVVGDDLKYSKTQSCGCLRIERVRVAIVQTKTTHGLRKSPEYLVWSNMKNRTANPNCKEYPYYGGRGITVCPEWRDSFARFYLDMGSRPSPKHQIERVDNDGNYEPSNCKWASKSEQMQNRSNARLVTIDGVTRNISEWTVIYGRYPSTVFRRLKRGFQGAALFTNKRLVAPPQN